MKKIIKFLLMAMFAITLAACHNVPNGYVGVKVDRYGDSRGVQNDVMGPGQYYSGWNTDFYDFPTFTQNVIWSRSPHEGKPVDESISFQTNEGTQVNGDFGIIYHINKDDTPKVFQKYRQGVAEISDIFLRNMVRDALNKVSGQRSLDDIMTNKSKFMTDVNAMVVIEAAAVGITVEMVSTISDFRYPSSIMAAMNGKMQATQQAMQAENELRRTRAEEEKKVIAAEARLKAADFDAQATKLKGASLAANPLVLQEMAIEKWDGHLPQVSGGSVPFINLQSAK